MRSRLKMSPNNYCSLFDCKTLISTTDQLKYLIGTDLVSDEKPKLNTTEVIINS